MSTQMPEVPRGDGTHPVALVVVSAPDLAASAAFYTRVFGWRIQPISAQLRVIFVPAGPMAALRSDVPEGFPGLVPYLAEKDVDAGLARAVAGGGTVERATSSIPMVGRIARFRDPSGTLYGLTDATVPGGTPHLPVPFGANPKPPAGAICMLEMYAAEGKAAPFFGGVFGWGTLDTMPGYTAFDPGAGPGGTFQSHTPALPAIAYVYANDVDAKIAEIESAGGKRMSDPMRVPGLGCFGYFTDPSGTGMGVFGE